MQNQKNPSHLYIITIILQCVVSILLLSIGIVQQFAKPAITRSNLNAELSSIETDLTNSQNAINNTFTTSGFSDSFYQTSNEQADLIEKQNEIKQTLNNLEHLGIVNSRAIYYYIASFIAISSIIPIIILKKKADL